jgi:3-methyladenine DNA glycosylase/8-oxoguanine DNA glycosylase
MVASARSHPAEPIDLDLAAALAHLRGVAGPMARLIDEHGPPPLSRTRNSFESLVRAIVYQQLSGRAAETIYRRFLDLFPRRRCPRPAALLAVPVERLRAAGLSRGKAVYLRDLAARFEDGTIAPRRFRRASSAEIGAMLLAVKGIGPWSVDMFLLFGLCRPDVLPVGDLGVRKGMACYFGLRALPAPAAMESLAAPWRPYRSVASWYLWRCAEEGVPGPAVYI